MTQKSWVLSHLILALILALCLNQFFQIRDAEAQLTFLDVGQGDSALIQTKEGKNILIDAGPDGRVVEELSRELNFFNQKIDLFILTHPHLDHYGGVLDILQKYPIKTVMLTGIASEDPVYLNFLRQLKNKEVTMLYPTQDEDLQIGRGLYIDFLYPFEAQRLMGQEAKNKNNQSVSLRLLNQDKRSLAVLTGDAEKEQEIELLLSGQDLSGEILKLGHHGSKTSSTPEFLKAVEARCFVISVGEKNTFKHPSLETLEKLKGEEVHRTDQEGNIHFVLE